MYVCSGPFFWVIIHEKTERWKYKQYFYICCLILWKCEWSNSKHEFNVIKIYIWINMLILLLYYSFLFFCNQQMQMQIYICVLWASCVRRTGHHTNILVLIKQQKQKTKMYVDTHILCVWFDFTYYYFNRLRYTSANTTTDLIHHMIPLSTDELEKTHQTFKLFVRVRRTYGTCVCVGVLQPMPPYPFGSFDNKKPSNKRKSHWILMLRYQQMCKHLPMPS